MSTKDRFRSDLINPISRDVALRIALATRVLPDTEYIRLFNVLEDVIGLPPTPEKLSTLTVKSFKAGLNGEFLDIDTGTIKETIAFLKGDISINEKKDIAETKTCEAGDIVNSIRVAFASNKAEELDGHFGSCLRFLIYQVSANEVKLIEIRNCNGPESRDSKNTFRANLIKDCHILFVVSIGGPAAAKVIRAGIHPVKYPNGGSTREHIKALQKVFVNVPPPWLAKITGYYDNKPMSSKGHLY